MAFVVKDLMIYVLSGQGLNVDFPGAPQAAGCGGNPCTHCSDSCSVGCTSPCSQSKCTQGCTTISAGGLYEMISNPADLTALKQRLRIALAEVEARETAVRAQMLPQTIEEADGLEKHLEGALAEVRNLKQRLSSSVRAERPPTG